MKRAFICLALAASPGLADEFLDVPYIAPSHAQIDISERDQLDSNTYLRLAKEREIHFWYSTGYVSILIEKEGQGKSSIRYIAHKPDKEGGDEVHQGTVDSDVLAGFIDLWRRWARMARYSDAPATIISSGHAYFAVVADGGRGYFEGKIYITPDKPFSSKMRSLVLDLGGLASLIHRHRTGESTALAPEGWLAMAGQQERDLQSRVTTLVALLTKQEDPR